jgi:cell division protein FtsB
MQTDGHFVLPKRLGLGVIAAIAVALVTGTVTLTSAVGRIDRLEQDIKPLQQVSGAIHERTIRIEEQVNAIRSRLDRPH